jgi:hypothetical protein
MCLPTENSFYYIDIKPMSRRKDEIVCNEIFSPLTKPPGQQVAIGRFVIPANYLQPGAGALLQNPSALNDAYQDHNNGNNEQNMDQAAHGI